MPRVFGLLIVSSVSYTRNRETFGSPNHTRWRCSKQFTRKYPAAVAPGTRQSGGEILRSQSCLKRRRPNRRKQAKAPEPDAIPLHARLPEKPSPRQASPQRYQPAPPPPNQVFSHEAPAANTPMFQKAGSGGIAWREFRVRTRLALMPTAWFNLCLKNGRPTVSAEMHSAPTVIVTFDILRDGSVRNVQIAQRSGNGTLDTSVQRAVIDAAPFPPLPQGLRPERGYRGTTVSITAMKRTIFS